MTQEERERIKRFAPLCVGHPLVEGMRPGRMVMLADGTRVWKESPPAEEWKDKELENMTILDKEEFYDHVTRCKHCGTKFIAYENDETVRNFCPGCGKEL